MPKHTLLHLSDAVLLHDLAALVARDRVTTAELLAHLAEVDVRRLYVPAGYPSMFAYCIEELRFSEDAAYRRIRAARAARQFPALFSAIEEGRLHLAAVSLLAPHLTSENVQELIEAATYRRKSELEELLARRFPSWSLPPRDYSSIRPFPQLGASADRVNGGLPLQNLLGGEGSSGGDLSPELLVPGRVVSGTAAGTGSDGLELVPGRVDSALEDTTSSGNLWGAAATPRSQSASRPERYLVQVTISRSTHDKLRRIQALLSHAVPTGDLAQVLDRALDALLEKVEKRKIGRRSRRAAMSPSADPAKGPNRRRYIPSHIRRAVWERDQGRCTFVNAAGHRCSARRFLEFDHVLPVARGGTASVEGLRLRCRAHNQLEAERSFGTGFMMEKRARARRERKEAGQRAEARRSLGPKSRRDAGVSLESPEPATAPGRGVSTGPHSGSS